MAENIFGGPRTERLKFFSDLHSIASDLSTKAISTEQANKLLMLACGSFHGSSTEMMDVYMHFKFPEESEEASVVLQELNTYLASLETTNAKIPMIKKCMELTGMGLKKAKGYIEEHYPEVSV